MADIITCCIITAALTAIISNILWKRVFIRRFSLPRGIVKLSSVPDDSRKLSYWLNRLLGDMMKAKGMKFFDFQTQYNWRIAGHIHVFLADHPYELGDVIKMLLLLGCHVTVTRVADDDIDASRTEDPHDERSRSDKMRQEYYKK